MAESRSEAVRSGRSGGLRGSEAASCPGSEMVGAEEGVSMEEYQILIVQKIKEADGRPSFLLKAVAGAP